jgi:hypothetical protein
LKLTAQSLTAGIDFAAGYWQFQFVRAQPSGQQNIVRDTWSVYPNPTADWLQIQGVSENVQWQVLDALGRLSLSGEGSTVEVSGLPAGPYVLRMQAADKSQSLRFIKR